ncbi:MAG: hypothetical protein HKO93_06980, partial [Flavobacteriales bacterium]|nr:hypothetical protein [Flavobacteriales bacterium]
ARFAAYTWSYFFLLPYKVTDPGTIWSDYLDNSPLAKKSNAKKLTFEEGIGDAPDDWYIIYSDKPSGLMDVAAYIVTAGASIEEAEKDPHAIEYENYHMVEGIPIAKNWTFWSWRETEGLVDTLGWAELNDFRFSSMDEALFSTEGLNKSMD